MNKIFLSIILFCLLSTIFTPVFTKAALVPCNGTVTCTGTGKDAVCKTDCDINAFFTMLGNIYNFIVYDIASPLALLALTIGGVLILISAGNANLLGTGKKIVYAAIIGLALVWGSYLIINFILTSIGYTGNWTKPT